MKAALVLSVSLLAAWVSLAPAVKVEAETTKSGAAALRGRTDVHLDPGWWKASTPPPPTAVNKEAPTATGIASNVTAASKEAPVPPADVSSAQLVNLLHKNEAGVQALESQMSTIHSRLLNAESGNVDAAGNVSLARSGMFNLASKAKSEADDLQKLTQRSAMVGSSLDLMENQLKASEKQVGSAAESAKATADIAEKTASQSALQAQDTLNNKIWKLVDPTNKDSLDATEKRVGVMEKAAAKFRGQVAAETKKVLVTKMQGAINGLRESVHDLGKAGNRAIDGALGKTE